MIHLSGKLSYEDQATPEGDQINQIPPYIVRSWSRAVNPWCSREEGNTHEKSGKQRIPPQTLYEPGQLWGLWGQGLTKDWGVLIGGGGKQLLLEESSVQLTKIPRAAHSVTLLSTAMAHHTRRRSRLTVFSLLGAYMWTFHLRLEKVTPTGRYRLLQAYGLCPPLALELPGVSFLCAGSSFSRHPQSPISIPLRRALPAPPHEVPAALAWRHLPAHSCPDGCLSVFVHRDPSPAPGLFLHPFAVLMLWTALPELSVPDTSRPFPAFPSAHWLPTPRFCPWSCSHISLATWSTGYPFWAGSVLHLSILCTTSLSFWYVCSTGPLAQGLFVFQYVHNFWNWFLVLVHAKLVQSCLTPCDPRE